jgi:hypothetical protein
MTLDERSFCRALVLSPPSSARKISKGEFMSRFPSAIERGMVASRLLEDVFTSRNSDDVQSALIVGHAFGFASEQVGLLTRLLEADWHVSHEDVVSALDKLRSPEGVNALYHATQWTPAYLSYDDSRALAGKAIWALGNLTGNEASAALQQLAASNDAFIKNSAKEQLHRRKV